LISELFLRDKNESFITFMKTKKILGVDIGNVIINHRLMDKENRDDWQEKYLSSPPVDNVFDSLRILNTEIFNGNVFLVSKCREEAEQLIKLWFKKHDFYSQTGIKPENTYFVRERKEKDIVCRKLGITHFIDDRLEVLSHMVGSTPNLYLFQPDPLEVEEFKKFLPRVIMVDSWDEVLKKTN